MVYLTRSCTLAADVIVLITTWLRTFRDWKEARRLKVALPLSTMLFRDGEFVPDPQLPWSPAQGSQVWIPGTLYFVFVFLLLMLTIKLIDFCRALLAITVGRLATDYNMQVN